MDRLQREHEADFLERVLRYRDEYRSGRAEDLKAERERRRANGEVYFGGNWILAQDVNRVARALQRREVVAFFEVALLLVLLVAIVPGLLWVFAFLFLPE